MTRSVRHSMSRIPLPYSNAPTNPTVPSSPANTRCTSCRVSTTGSRTGARARGIGPNPSSGRPSTSRYRNSNAANACPWVEDATPRSTVRCVRKLTTSRSPSSPGCRSP